GRIGVLRFDPLGRFLLIGTEDPGSLSLMSLGRFTAPWRAISAQVRDAVCSPDGEIIAVICTDGSEWFYSMQDEIWVYTHDHESEPLSAEFSPDGTRFVSVDAHGVVILRSIAETFSARPAN